MVLGRFLTVCFMTVSILIGGGIAMAQNGLDIEIITEGTGAAATKGQRVSVHYEGKLTDGSVFDASRPRGDTFSFNLGQGQVIPGWEMGVEGMKVGEVRRLTIAPELGYGAAGAGDVIPPNATLIFEVELVALSTPPQLGQASNQDLIAAQKDGVIIVDIRGEDEWQQTGIIEGAKTITAFTPSGTLHPEFQQHFMSLVTSPDMPILLYCRTGNRTSMIGNALVNQLGFSNVSHLSEGIVGWQEDGLQTTPYQGD